MPAVVAAHVLCKSICCISLLALAVYLNNTILAAVEQFCKLIAWCEQDQHRAKCVQRVLKVMRGWDAAATHAKTAVPEDSRPRMFDLGTGMVLLYTCKQGKVDIKKATGEQARLVRCLRLPQRSCLTVYCSALLSTVLSHVLELQYTLCT